MDVTDIVNRWLSGSIPNDGFIIKRSGSIANTDTNTDEGNATHLGRFSFFSRETHTIYQPKLEVVWNDSKWVTGFKRKEFPELGGIPKHKRMSGKTMTLRIPGEQPICRKNRASRVARKCRHSEFLLFSEGSAPRDPPGLRKVGCLPAASGAQILQESSRNPSGIL